MGKKNKRAKLELALHQMRDERDRETETVEERPRRSPDLAFEGRLPEQDQHNSKGALIIPLDPDINIEDLPTSVLRRPYGHRTKNTDEARVIEYLQNRELKAPGARLDRIDASTVFHARSHADVSKAVDKFAEMAEKVEFLSIGLDLEGKEREMSVTLQLAAEVENETFIALFQLQSLRDMEAPAHIFSEGPPTKLKKIFDIKN